MKLQKKIKYFIIRHIDHFFHFAADKLGYGKYFPSIETIRSEMYFVKLSYHIDIADRTPNYKDIKEVLLHGLSKEMQNYVHIETIAISNDPIINYRTTASIYVGIKRKKSGETL